MSDLVLGIETSCDETAAAIVGEGSKLVSSVVSSQVDIHAEFGGVVPELAGRAHVQLIVPVVEKALGDAGLDTTKPSIGSIACTIGPGLVGSLLVGVSAAKAMAYAWGVPFIGVNHLEAHLYASFLADPELEFPMMVLLVSGGHTMLIHAKSHGDYVLVGQTLDDAAGEAFDKVARFIGLGYPGGPAIDKAAQLGDASLVRFPRPMIDSEGFEFSFSGLKTSVVAWARKHPDASAEDISACFQEAVVDVLVTKAIRAAREAGVSNLCIGGGVAANSALRAETERRCAEEGLRAFIPARAFCTDNAAMVAAAGWWRMQNDGPSVLSTGAIPNLRFP